MATVIDADTHTFEQPGMWRDRMAKADRHLALEIEEDALGYSWLTHKGKRLLQCYISEPGKLWESYGLPHQRQRDGEPALIRYTDMPATYYDSGARRDALDDWGIDEQVMFPNWGLNFGWYLEGDVPSEMANIGAWNRWAAEMRAEGRGRLRPVGHLTFRGDPSWIDAQLDALAAAGITQVFIPAGLVDGKRMSHPEFDRVWSRMTDLGLVPTFHIGAFAERVIDDGWQENDIIQYMTVQSLVMTGLDVQLSLSDLVLNGVFDRHPGLKVVVTEYLVTWLPELCYRLDGGYDVHYQVTGMNNVDLKMRPSEYLKERVRLVSFPNEEPGRIMDATADILMYGSDYPHAEGVGRPLLDYQDKVGDLGDRADGFYGETFAAVVPG